MPNGIIPNEGLAAVLQRILDPAHASPATWRAVLWVNDITPDAFTVLADLVQASFGGYFFATLDPTLWTAADVSDGCAMSTYTDTTQNWVVGDPKGQTVYGWALVDWTVGQIRFVQRFDDGDIVALETGNTVRLLPTLTLTSAACGGALATHRRRIPRHER